MWRNRLRVSRTNRPIRAAGSLSDLTRGQATLREQTKEEPERAWIAETRHHFEDSTEKLSLPQAHNAPRVPFFGEQPSLKWGSVSL